MDARGASYENVKLPVLRQKLHLYFGACLLPRALAQLLFQPAQAPFGRAHQVKGPAGTHLLQIAHELERVGDRATNVAERVIYTVTGELIELNV